MPTISIGDTDLYYEIHGDGTPVLLVAGLGGAGAYWTPQLPDFAARHKIILHDHRGTGKSAYSATSYSVDQMSADLIRLMDRLEIEKAHIVGHSTGGAIGQTLAIEHPERLSSLVIYASWTKADPFFRRVMECRRALAYSAGRGAYNKATPTFLYPNWWINQEAAQLSAADAAADTSGMPPEIIASRIDAIVAFDRSSDLGCIKTPTMVICAEDDYLTPSYFSRALTEAITGAELVLLPRGGHAVSQTCPEEFNRPVLEFLRENDPAGAAA